MSTRTYTVTFNAPGEATLPQGRFFYIKTAASALTIEARGRTSAPVRFDNVGAGLKFGPVQIDKAWNQLILTSAGIQTVEVIISDDSEVDIASTVTVSGSVTVQDQPSTTVATPAAVTVLNATAATIPANASRKRIRICADPENAGALDAGCIYVQAVGAGAGIGVPLSPGIFERFDTLAALDVRNDTGASAIFTTFEES